MALGWILIAITNAIVNNNFLPIIAHDIDDGEGAYAWPIANWQGLVDYLADNNIPTYTMSEFYEKIVNN